MSSNDNYRTHTILQSEDCDCDDDAYCSVCNGGLAYCTVCHGGEIELEQMSCGERVKANAVTCTHEKVYYHAEHSNYYCTACHQGMGGAFYRLAQALHDAIRRPMGVVPSSAEPFVNRGLMDAAESRRPQHSDALEVLRAVERVLPESLDQASNIAKEILHGNSEGQSPTLARVPIGDAELRLVRDDEDAGCVHVYFEGKPHAMAIQPFAANHIAIRGYKP